MYWFQSRSFTIDLRLKARRELQFRNAKAGLAIRFGIAPANSCLGSERLRQLPESCAVAGTSQVACDWQLHSGIFSKSCLCRRLAPAGTTWPVLGLRLQSAIEVQSGQSLEMDGGLIICADHIAYALTRLPEVQNAVAQMDLKAIDPTVFALLESFEVSIGTDGQTKTYSTRTSETGKTFNLENFEVLDETRLVQNVILDGRDINLIFEIDIYQPDFVFQNTTVTTSEAENWLKSEQDHLMHHAERVL